MSAFEDELVLRLRLFGVVDSTRGAIARGADPCEAVVAALTRTIGKPPVRGAQKRRLVGLMLEIGVPPETLEPFLAPAPPRSSRR